MGVTHITALTGVSWAHKAAVREGVGIGDRIGVVPGTLAVIVDLDMNRSE